MRHFCTPRFASRAAAGLALFLASALFVLPSAFAAETQALARKTRTKTKTKTTLVPGNTIHVPADQPTIQAGINAASNGDTVLVSPGTYTENIDFMGKQITLTSVSGPAVTIIDGGGYNTNFSATVNFSTNETANSILSGFTIQDGQSSDIFITNAAPTIQGNVIQGSSFLGNCYNYGYCEDGIDLWQGAAALIQGNLIVINGQEGVSTNGDSGTQLLGNIVAYSGDAGVQFGNAGGTELIQQNSIFGNYNGGIVYGSYTGTSSASIIQNLVYANLGPGVQWQSAPFSLISNTIANNGPGQFNNCCSLATEAVGTITNQVTIQNNLIASDQNLPAFDCYYLPPAAPAANYYFPYGGLQSSTGSDPNHFKFTSKERDTESGLDDFGARYYGSTMGRLMTPDPLLNSGRPADPQSWNRYSYAFNNPLKFIDPTGLYNLVSHCKDEDKKCIKKENEAAEWLRKGEAALQKKVDNMNDGPEKARLQASLKAMGTENDENNVYVSVGTLNGNTAAHTDTSYNPTSHEISFGVTFDLSPSKSNTDANGLAINGAHEGTHIADTGDPRFAANQLNDFQGEYRAYETSAWAAHALGVGSPFWNSSFGAVDDKVITKFIIDNYKGKNYEEKVPHDPWPN